ncbi:hypothetical protein PF006_g27796 [Phytophthora fragariae]|uniref:RxLR effector protein n=1 Tax=Phytophthora fragariae TaxID=53985 RepID=A0A6A3QKA4_9STRA|nr:hypothetical protein PF009_g27863 [Phytophthora fragariae]KAE9078040.1 hypothetical protein PF006_g27796 [Phytophthora fragariae]
MLLPFTAPLVTLASVSIASCPSPASSGTSFRNDEQRTSTATYLEADTHCRYCINASEAS